MKSIFELFIKKKIELKFVLFSNGQTLWMLFNNESQVHRTKNWIDCGKNKNAYPEFISTDDEYIKIQSVHILNHNLYTFLNAKPNNYPMIHRNWV